MKHLQRVFAFVVALMVCLTTGALAYGILSQEEREEPITISAEEYALLEKYKRLEEIQSVIDRAFLWEYDEDALLEGAAQGMLGALGDDYTFYYTPTQMASENETLSGEYAGVGIEVFPNTNDDTITIKRVFHGGPAQQAGLRPYDKIIGVNGQEMRASDINDAVSIMKGEIGGEVTLSILREQEIFEVTMERAVVQTEIIQYRMLENNLAYMRIFYFEGNFSSQLEDARADMEAQGAKGLILDLRSNPGGLVEFAIEAVDVFVDEVPILRTEDKYGRTLAYYGKKGAWDIPVVVLMDEYSASASEIVASALQECDVAKVVGMQSYGKGIMQTVYPFSEDGAGMQITSDYWLTPNGNNLHEVGVTPDYSVELPEDAYDENYSLIDEKDTQLHKAIEVLQEMIGN